MDIKEALIKDRVLCKYCGKPMRERFDDYDTLYSCDCDDYLKEGSLVDEIRDLERKCWKKREELSKLRGSNIYNCSLRKLEEDIQNLKRAYGEQ
jgi:hypothetical protein